MNFKTQLINFCKNLETNDDATLIYEWDENEELNQHAYVMGNYLFDVHKRGDNYSCNVYYLDDPFVIRMYPTMPDMTEYVRIVKDNEIVVTDNGNIAATFKELVSSYKTSVISRILSLFKH